MDNFGKLFHQAIQNDPLHIIKGYKKKFENDSSIYPLFPRFPNTRNIQRYVKKLIAFHSNLAEGEIQIQKQNSLITDQKYRELVENIKNIIGTVDEISRTKTDTIEEHVHVWKTLREIEWGIPIGTIQFAKKEEYQKARESYQTVLNIIFTQIEIGRIISDDIEE